MAPRKSVDDLIRRRAHGSRNDEAFIEVTRRRDRPQMDGVVVLFRDTLRKHGRSQ